MLNELDLQRDDSLFVSSKILLKQDKCSLHPTLVIEFSGLCIYTEKQHFTYVIENLEDA